MPVTIGAKPASDFSDPLGLLGDCHRRIERFLGVLVKVTAQAKGQPMTEQQKREWLNALEYFQNAAPRHTADEEESLFPRLREMEHQGIQDALAQMETLEADHKRADQLHAVVDQLGKRWVAETVLSAEDTSRLSEALAQLSELYEGHIALEDNRVFPLAAAALPVAKKTEIGKEMAQRRGLNRPVSLEVPGRG